MCPCRSVISTGGLAPWFLQAQITKRREVAAEYIRDNFKVKIILSDSLMQTKELIGKI